MKMTHFAGASLFLFTVTATGMALAQCPGSMPEPLLEDCIVYEGAGQSFPTSDYAHMELYDTWVKDQEAIAKRQQAKLPAK
jgi:hypothetical protein